MRIRVLLLFGLVLLAFGCEPDDSSSEPMASSGLASSVDEDLAAASDLLADLDPFVTWDPVSNVIDFDEEAAVASGLAADRIQLSVDIQRLNEAALRPEPPVDSPKADAWDGAAPPGVAVLTSFTFNSLLWVLGDKCAAWPGWSASYASKAGAVAKLTGAGFSYTASPSGVCSGQGAGAYGQDGSDYTKPLYLCTVAFVPTKCYRYHGRVTATSPWKFRVQGAGVGGTSGVREPNPELCQYVWPYWWWGAYTFYFHHYYC